MGRHISPTRWSIQALLLVHTKFILVTNNIVRRSGRESAVPPWAQRKRKNTKYCVFLIYKYIYIRVQIDIYIFNCACSPPVHAVVSCCHCLMEERTWDWLRRDCVIQHDTARARGRREAHRV